MQQDLAQLGIKLGPGPPVPAQAILSMSREQLIEARSELERAKMVRIAAQVDLEDEQRKNAELGKLMSQYRGGCSELEQTADSLKKKWLDENSRRMLAEKRATDAEVQLALLNEEIENSRAALIEMHALLQHHVGEKERLQVFAWEQQSNCAKLQARSVRKQQEIWSVAQQNRELQKHNRMMHMQTDRGKRLVPQPVPGSGSLLSQRTEHSEPSSSEAPPQTNMAPPEAPAQTSTAPPEVPPPAGQRAYLPSNLLVGRLRGSPFG